MEKRLLMYWKFPKDSNKYNADILFYNDKEYKSNELFPNILVRLLNSKRPDYDKILEQFNLTREPSKWDILCHTKGRPITDTYEFIEPNL